MFEPERTPEGSFASLGFIGRLQLELPPMPENFEVHEVVDGVNQAVTDCVLDKFLSR